jgi:cobalt-zinc-cadmium efflux system membrane fusion protein
MRTTALLLIVAVTLPLHAEDVVVLDEQQLARAGVTVEEVGQRGFGDRQRVVGQVVRVPGSTLTLKTPIGGRVETIEVAPGDRVSAGDVMVTLHCHDLLTMQSELLRARERAKLAATRLEAGRELFEVEGISRLDLEQREQEAFAASLEQRILREELLDHGFPEVSLEAVLENRTTNPHLPVVAPVDGVVLELVIEEHEWVEEYRELLVMGDPNRVELELQLSPDQASAVSRGDTILFNAAGRPDDQGRAEAVQRVPQVDPGTRTIKLRARIVEARPWVYPGVFVEGAVVHGETRTAASVPAQAVINLEGRDVVFVKRADGAFEPREVTLGVSDKSHVEVVGGVEVGERIATGGVFLLKSTLVGGGGDE